MKDVYKALKPATRRWVDSIKARYELEDFHERLLLLAGQAWDRVGEARVLIRKDGAILKDRWNQSKPNPACEIESRSMLTFAKLLREVGLDLERPEDPRPPRQY